MDNLQNTRSSTLTYFLLASFILFLNIARLPTFFAHPIFYAEDGHFLFINSVELGWNALFKPMVGSPFLVARFFSIVLLKCQVPIYWMPAAYALVGGVISSLCYAWLFRPGFRWILPSDGGRALLAIALSLLPGNDEIFFPLCSLYYRFGVLLILLLLEANESGEWRMSWKRALGISFLWFSMGQGIIFVPALLLLYFFSRQKTYLFALSTLFFAALWNASHTVETGFFGMPGATFGDSIGMLLKVFVENLFLRFWVLPVFGSWVSEFLIAGSDVWFAGCIIFSVPVILWIFLKMPRPPRKEILAFLFLILCVLGGILLSVIVRPWGYQFYSRPGFHLSARFSVVPGALCLLFYTFLCCAPKSPFFRWTSRFRYLYLALLVFHLLHDSPFQPVERWIEKEERWANLSEGIERTLQSKRAGELSEAVKFESIPLRPRGWYSQDNVLTISP